MAYAQVYRIVVAITMEKSVSEVQLKQQSMEVFIEVNTQITSLINAILERVLEVNLI